MIATASIDFDMMHSAQYPIFAKFYLKTLQDVDDRNIALQRSIQKDHQVEDGATSKKYQSGVGGLYHLNSGGKSSPPTYLLRQRDGGRQGEGGRQEDVREREDASSYSHRSRMHTTDGSLILLLIRIESHHHHAYRSYKEVSTEVVLPNDHHLLPAPLTASS